MDDIPRLQVTALYEDLEAGLRAKHLIQRVQTGTDFPLQIKLDLWRFDWLREQSLRNFALNAARHSALTIVSISHDDLLPAELEPWVAAWTRTAEENHTALFVLFPRERNHRNHPHSLHEQLQRAARQKHVDFFCECFDSGGSSRRSDAAENSFNLNRTGNTVRRETLWRTSSPRHSAAC